MGTSKTLDEIIQNLLIDEGKNSEAEYLRYLNIGLRGLKELNMDVGKDIKSIELTVGSNGSVDFPSDYIGYTKIGRADSDGRVHVLGIEQPLQVHLEWRMTIQTIILFLEIILQMEV